jgi:hypothetical protein
MRTFSVTYSVPGNCDCCGAALNVAPKAASPGLYTLELPEGTAPTEIRISDSMQVTIGGGKLQVRLRQTKGSNKQWDLKRHYNTSAFGHAKTSTEYPADAPDFYWYVFNFELPEFRPAFSTWWAELQFSEVPYRGLANSGNSEAHNSPKLSVRLTKLE